MQIIPISLSILFICGLIVSGYFIDKIFIDTLEENYKYQRTWIMWLWPIVALLASILFLTWIKFPIIKYIYRSFS